MLVAPSAVINVFNASVTSIIRSLDFRRSIGNAVAGAVMGTLAPRDLQRIMPSGVEAYTTWMARFSESSGRDSYIASTVEILGDGIAKLYWIGEKDAQSRVILFLHGGGYCLPLSKGYFDWAYEMFKSGESSGCKISVAVLDYTLCPEEKYPTQMYQGVLALEHILKLGYQPHNIMLGGDSAGGNLCLSLFSHLMHSYDDQRFPKLRLTGPLCGAFVISPLVSLDLSTKSFKENAYSDILSLPNIRDWGALMFDETPFSKESQEGLAWGMALDGSDEWWRALNTTVKRLYISAGGQELFRDHVVEFSERIRRLGVVDLKSYIDEKDSHDAIYVNFQQGKAIDATRLRLMDWIIASFMNRE
ncbi:hypothetical protein IFR05_015726 [Cadophora sp. M221]|nr:hypothetical protein IFR05_015726 [Cadophora sp. M221]